MNIDHHITKKKPKKIIHLILQVHYVFYVFFNKNLKDGEREKHL